MRFKTDSNQSMVYCLTGNQEDYGKGYKIFDIPIFDLITKRPFGNLKHTLGNSTTKNRSISAGKPLNKSPGSVVDKSIT